MKRPAKVHAVLRHQQHLLFVALFGLTANPGISVAAARSLRQGIGVAISGPVQENSPAEEEEAEEALADEEAAPPTHNHDLAFVSQQQDLETQPPTPSPASFAPPAPMPQSILAPPPFAAPPMSPFAAPPMSLAPAPGLMLAPQPALVPAPVMAPAPAMAPALAMAPAPAVMQSPYGPELPLVEADESTQTTPTTTATEEPSTTREEPSTTTSSQEDKKETAELHVAFKNVDYNALTADKALLDDFKETVKEDIAEKAGHGVTPDDVEVTLRPGSVIVDAKITVPEGSSQNTVQKAVCSSASSQADDAAKDIKAIDGISNAVSGTVQGEVLGNCATTTTTTKAAPAKALKSAAADDDEDNMDSCHPTCVQGQGVCSDKVCFCKSPFSGIRCERVRKSSSHRLSYPLAAGVAAFGLFAGVVIGVLFFAGVMAPKMKHAAVTEKKAETWHAS